MTPIHVTPVLYSFRRCPYAMRARLALISAACRVELREIELRNKPSAMLTASPKGTVPVLVLTDGRVIDESLDIMQWALQQHDPDAWLPRHDVVVQALVSQNDGDFKRDLDRYKYADRYPEHPQSHYRCQGERFLAELEARLEQSPFLAGEDFGFADAAIAPFIRQFAAVDGGWFEQAPYPRLRDWLVGFLESALFVQAMQRHEIWTPDSPGLFFPA